MFIHIIIYKFNDNARIRIHTSTCARYINILGPFIMFNFNSMHRRIRQICYINRFNFKFSTYNYLIMNYINTINFNIFHKNINNLLNCWFFIRHNNMDIQYLLFFLLPNYLANNNGLRTSRST